MLRRGTRAFPRANRENVGESCAPAHAAQQSHFHSSLQDQDVPQAQRTSSKGMGNWATNGHLRKPALAEASGPPTSEKGQPTPPRAFPENGTPQTDPARWEKAYGECGVKDLLWNTKLVKLHVSFRLSLRPAQPLLSALVVSAGLALPLPGNLPFFLRLSSGSRHAGVCTQPS